MGIIKLSVTVVLPGSTMLTSQECEENPQESYNKHFIMLQTKHYDKKTKKFFFKKEPLKFKTRKCATAQQVIKMTDDAYNYMISQACPEWFIPFGGISKWKKLSKKERLEAHLERVCQSLKGISYTYAVFGD